MEEDAAEWDRVEDGDKGEAARDEAAWAVPLRGAPEAPVCVRNAGIANRTNWEYPAYRSRARNAARR